MEKTKQLLNSYKEYHQEFRRIKAFVKQHGILLASYVRKSQFIKEPLLNGRYKSYKSDFLNHINQVFVHLKNKSNYFKELHLKLKTYGKDVKNEIKAFEKSIKYQQNLKKNYQDVENTLINSQISESSLKIFEEISNALRKYTSKMLENIQKPDDYLENEGFIKDLMKNFQKNSFEQNKVDDNRKHFKYIKVIANSTTSTRYFKRDENEEQNNVNQQYLKKEDLTLENIENPENPEINQKSLNIKTERIKKNVYELETKAEEKEQKEEVIIPNDYYLDFNIQKK